MPASKGDKSTSWLHQAAVMEYPLYKETWRGTPCEVILVNDLRHLRQPRCEWCENLQETLLNLSNEAGERLKMLSKSVQRHLVFGRWEGADDRLPQNRKVYTSRKPPRQYERLLGKHKPPDLCAKFVHYKESYREYLEDYRHKKTILQAVQKPLRDHRVVQTECIVEHQRPASLDSIHEHRQEEEEEEYSMLTPMSLLLNGPVKESYSYRALGIAMADGIPDRLPQPHISHHLMLSYKPHNRQQHNVKKGHLCKPGRIAHSKADRSSKEKQKEQTSSLFLPKLTITEKVKHGIAMGKCELYWINTWYIKYCICSSALC